MLRYRVSPNLADAQLNELFAATWDGWEKRDFQPVLQRSLGWVGAFADDRLVGFVNLGWDGGVHAFLLDTTVHPQFRRSGVGRELVRRSVEIGRNAELEWVHVDFEERLAGFYLKSCGFAPTAAGLFHVGGRFRIDIPPAAGTSRVE